MIKRIFKNYQKGNHFYYKNFEQSNVKKICYMFINKLWKNNDVIPHKKEESYLSLRYTWTDRWSWCCDLGSLRLCPEFPGTEWRRWRDQWTGGTEWTPRTRPWWSRPSTERRPVSEFEAWTHSYKCGEEKWHIHDGLNSCKVIYFAINTIYTRALRYLFVFVDFFPNG